MQKEKLLAITFIESRDFKASSRRHGVNFKMGLYSERRRQDGVLGDNYDLATLCICG